MQMSNTCSIPANVEITWQALNDPEFLKECIAGCESIDRVAENDYKVVLAAKVGPVSARFSGRMLLEDLVPPTSYAIRFEGQGGAAGFAKGRAQVALAPEGDGSSTAMTYKVDAQVGGKLAQIGSRLIDAAARKVADDFFSAFTAKIAGLQPQAAAEAQPAAAGAAVTNTSSGSSGRIARWAAAAAVIAGAGWWLVTRMG